MPSIFRKESTAGWRTVGNQRCYFRSTWEANYAKYLEWLRVNKQIRSWKHEPRTFWFENIKRGVRSYLPDFLVEENDNTFAFHEVKGWMDSKSKTKISRMKKYYPDVKLIVVDQRSYRSIVNKVSRIIPDWE